MQGPRPSGPAARTDAEARAILDAEIDRLAPRREALGEAGVHSVAGWTLTHAMEWEAALLAWARAASLEPDDPELVHQHGICLLELGRWDEAAARFRDVLAIDERLVAAGLPGIEWMEEDPAYRLGTALHAKGDLRGAIEAYERSTHRNTTGTDALREMTRAHLALREPEAALDALARLDRRTVRLSLRAEAMAMRADAARMLRELGS